MKEEAECPLILRDIHLPSTGQWAGNRIWGGGIQVVVMHRLERLYLGSERPRTSKKST